MFQKDLSTALTRQAADQERTRKRRDDADRRAREAERRAERARTDATLSDTEKRLTRQIAEMRPPKVEPLLILLVTAASEGDLRLDKELRRINLGIKKVKMRDHVILKHLPAATASDFLSGMSGFQPHIVHFAGHANGDLVVFDTNTDTNNPGHRVSGALFARAVGSVDEPPLLVVLNACDSSGHLDGLLDVVPMAIGMADEIHNRDAISFAARFYSAIADGQSVGSAFKQAVLQMELDGMPDADLPVLASRPDLDPSQEPLVLTMDD